MLKLCFYLTQFSAIFFLIDILAIYTGLQLEILKTSRVCRAIFAATCSLVDMLVCPNLSAETPGPLTDVRFRVYFFRQED
jgi:hypothetical protein